MVYFPVHFEFPNQPLHPHLGQYLSARQYLHLLSVSRNFKVDRGALAIVWPRWD